MVKEKPSLSVIPPARFIPAAVWRARMERYLHVGERFLSHAIVGTEFIGDEFYQAHAEGAGDRFVAGHGRDRAGMGAA
jgi:hypothetical protein